MYNFHGDVILKKVDQIPKDAERIEIKQNKVVIEKGEGVHTHVLTAQTAQELNRKAGLYQKNGQMFLKILSPVRIDHEEHGKQIIDIGLYKKDIEIEYDYEANEERRIID